MSGNTILVIEDEADIRELLAFSLERAGFTVQEARDSEEALRRLEGPLPDLLLIDWMLPGMTGIDLARRLRKDPLTAELPLIMLTAKSEEADKLKSYDVGIDDYVTKPFSPRELVARIKAVLRRTGAPEAGQLAFGPLVLDTQSHRLSLGGDNIHIGPTEFRLLEFLMRHPEQAFDREQLLDRVWGRAVYVEERTVDVHILRLRKVLKPFGVADWVQTVRGVGYRFSPRGQRRIAVSGALAVAFLALAGALLGSAFGAPALGALLVVALHQSWQALQFRRLNRWFDQGSGHPPMLFGALHRFSWRIYRQRRGTKSPQPAPSHHAPGAAARHPSPTGRCGPPGGRGTHRLV